MVPDCRPGRLEVGFLTQALERHLWLQAPLHPTRMPSLLKSLSRRPQQQLPKWWGQDDLYRVTRSTADVRPGGKWRSEGAGADGTTFHVEGEYLEVEPPRLLVHTWLGSYGPQIRTVVRWELEPQTVHGLHPGGPKAAGTGTLVRVRHEGFAGHIDSAKSHGEGWKRVLGWLKAFVETA
jgi:uncharacterized protein YndB with AHSA1/START domain